MTFAIGGPEVEIPTLGVELEYLVVDPETRELSSDTEVLLSEGEQLWGAHIRPEFHAPVIECLTAPCQDVRQVEEQLLMLRRTLVGLARKHGFRMISSSTHPTTKWTDVKLSEGERYLQIQQSLGDVARSNLICGLHCHIGIRDPDARIAVMNAARYFLPTVLALSASSPFWQSRDTGLASARTGIFRRFPRTGIPGLFDEYAEFDRYVEMLKETGCIEDGKSIYWDIRPHTTYPTIEFRGCDVPARISETGAIVGLLHAICTRLVNLHHRNMSYRIFRRSFIEENLYRAMTSGLDGEFLDLQYRCTRPVKEVIARTIEEFDDEIKLLQLEPQMQELTRIVEQGNSAQRQRAARSGDDFASVVDHLIAETEAEVL